MSPNEKAGGGEEAGSAHLSSADMTAELVVLILEC